MTAVAMTVNFGRFVQSPSDFELLRECNPDVYIEPIGTSHAIILNKAALEIGQEILLCDSRSVEERATNSLPVD